MGLAIVLAGATIAMPVDAARSPAVSRFVKIDLPGGTRPGVAAIAHRDDGTWWAAGSVADEAGVRRPALWTSGDGVDWAVVPIDAQTPYGKVSELYSVAATARGVVALGAATGGAHGNPRTASWVLGSDGQLHDVIAAFELYNGPRQIAVRSIVDGPAGWVIFGARTNRNDALGATSWTSATGDDFVIHDADVGLSSGAGESIIGLDVAFDPSVPGGQLIAVGERFHAVVGQPESADTDLIAWTSPDGVTWQRWTPPGLRVTAPDIQRAQRIAIGGQRVLMAGIDDNVIRSRVVTWTTNDRRRWTRSIVAPFGTSRDSTTSVMAAVVDSSRMIIGARMNDRLRLALSTTGRTWTDVALPADLPTGIRSRIAVGATTDVLLVGATSLNGGGLWRTTLRPAPTGSNRP
jgi:hypothetical protein